jgi:hypothetical protein
VALKRQRLVALPFSMTEAFTGSEVQRSKVLGFSAAAGLKSLSVEGGRPVGLQTKRINVQHRTFNADMAAKRHKNHKT